MRLGVSIPFPPIWLHETLGSCDYGTPPTTAPTTPSSASTTQGTLDTPIDLTDSIGKPTNLLSAFEEQRSRGNPQAFITPRLESLRKKRRNTENKLRCAWDPVMGSIEDSIGSVEGKYENFLSIVA